MASKSTLRKEMRALRREHASAIPENIRGLIFRHPPGPLRELIKPDWTIGLYHAAEHEAPASGYARHFSEAGHPVALPRFESEDSPMDFAAHDDPFGEQDLEHGPFGIMQPAASSAVLTPDILFVPLLAFSDQGARLGQGGGHYDRWLADNPHTKAIGMAWDCQLLDQIPTEPHDMMLDAIVTPTRLYGPF